MKSGGTARKTKAKETPRSVKRKATAYIVEYFCVHCDDDDDDDDAAEETKNARLEKQHELLVASSAKNWLGRRRRKN